MKKLVQILLIGVFIVFSYSCKHEHSDVLNTATGVNNVGNQNISSQEDVSLPDATQQEISVAIQALEEATKYNNDKKEAVKKLKQELSNIKIQIAGTFDGITYYIWDLSKLGGKKFISSSNHVDNYTLLTSEIEKGKYDEVGPLVKTNNGLLARAKKDGKWGYISEDNVTRISFLYDMTYSFRLIRGGLSPHVGSDNGHYYGCVLKDGKYTFLLSNEESVDNNLYALEYVPTGTYPNGFILEKYLVDGSNYRKQNSCAIFPFGNVKFKNVENNDTCTNKLLNDIGVNAVVQRTFYWDVPRGKYTEEVEWEVSTVKSCDYIKKFIEKHKDQKMQFVIYPITNYNKEHIVNCAYSK